MPYIKTIWAEDTPITTALLNKIENGIESAAKDALPLTGGTLTGETTFNNYLKLNAWSGYGSGTANFWYDGTNKTVEIETATDLKLNGTKVSKEGHTHNSTYLKLSGGTLTGNVYIDNSYEADLHLICGSRDAGLYLNTSNFGIYDWENNVSIIRYNYSANKLELNGKRAVVMENYDYNYKIRGGSGMSGTAAPKKVYFGTAEVKKIYFGTALVWAASETGSWNVGSYYTKFGGNHYQVDIYVTATEKKNMPKIKW